VKFGLFIVSFLVGSSQVSWGPVLFAQTAKLTGMAGKLVAVHDHYISVSNDQLTKTFQINAETKIWRGQDIALPLGRDNYEGVRRSRSDCQDR